MARSTIHVLALALAIVATPNAAANDGAATLAAGGIQFRHLEGVAMRSEDLFISPDEVRVAYVFENLTRRDIATEVAFPLPGFEEEPDQDVELDLSSDNPMRFSVSVDGKPVAFRTRSDRHDGRVWLVHHWRQVFKAGATVRIEHRYRPVAGVGWVSSEDLAQFAADYCLPLADTTPIAAGAARQRRDVSYVLTTARTWKGPIGAFHLRIEASAAAGANAPRPYSCFHGVERQADGSLEARFYDYSPAGELEVVFFPTDLATDEADAAPNP